MQLRVSGAVFVFTRKDTNMAARKKTEVTEPKKIIGTVIGGSLNVRAGDNLNTEVVTTLEDGTQIEILEAGEEWHRIEAGYVMARWVKLDA